MQCEQAFGFVRVCGGPEPLDATILLPSMYPAAHAVLRAAGATLDTPVDQLAAKVGSRSVRQLLVCFNHPRIGHRRSL